VGLALFREGRELRRLPLALVPDELNVVRP
jgi:hypothetical protein